ncbi:related to DNA excision repair protein ERCC-8 [Ramularia collo-cygni]|uniref:Related to DNA excision repair protein ERCC-8 n=1 Tax=Ramularia collo-cygni TaxID=112498 RepID=A0A2D3V0G5_9PEZI|nr:related to DNA excision repair protein ERCC-8 [Ramularia collo-cygni]CZT18157.1 related to DNA excision repair protein ERCC-8 [Ramularia collo-cygni]
MNSFLFNRQLGAISSQALAKAQNNRLLKALQATDVRFALDHQDGTRPVIATAGGSTIRTRDVAHAAGVSSIAIDRFEGRYLISAGADSSLAVWDLESAEASSGEVHTHVPLEVTARTSTTASLGITHISFYPFDSLALLTSGYDHTLKLFSSETLKSSASFDLGSVIYSHATSNIASHLLVACASQHPAVRLVDLRSGASTHSLPGHHGSVLSVAWHPRDEHVLASSATDGVVRLWDIRRSASSLGVLDLEDSIGVAGYDGKGTGARGRERGKSHIGAANGIVWTEDGRYLLSNGHDERMRIWDVQTGANTLANFGPGLKNSSTTAVLPLIVPSHLSELGKETIFYPNPKEILGFDMHSGTLQSRLRVKGLPGSDSNARSMKSRTTALAWRAHSIEMYSAHGDGTIRCWRPRTMEDVVAEQEQAVERDGLEGDGAERKRKREEFERVVQDLTKKKILFS